MKKKFAFIVNIFVVVGLLAIYKQWKNNMIDANTVTSTSDNSLIVLTANVGTINLGCKDYLYNLCYKDVEKRISNNIQELKPDVVAFQEILAPKQCFSVQERNQKKVCFDSQDIPQIRRILGDEYSIVCDQRGHFTCMALRVDRGEFLECERGEMCNSARTGHSLSGCDNGFTVSAATIKLDSGFIFDVVNAHPQSTDEQCRSKMISLIFRGDDKFPPLIQEERVLLMGDYNFDPWRDDDESVELWQEIFSNGWMGNDFRYHSGIVENDPPRFTSFLFFQRKTVDLVVSNFTDGICAILGETPGTSRLDGGKGMDHRAVYGSLIISQ